ncbi:MAG: hypothetical protein WCN98_15360, partial [Verrucomicrobiaceae bacterium]
MAFSEAEAISLASAEAVAAAMSLIKELMPEASERRRLLMILANAASSCGMLGVDRKDVFDLVQGAFELGKTKGPVP